MHTFNNHTESSESQKPSNQGIIITLHLVAALVCTVFVAWIIIDTQQLTYQGVTDTVKEAYEELVE